MICADLTESTIQRTFLEILQRPHKDSGIRIQILEVGKVQTQRPRYEVKLDVHDPLAHIKPGHSL